MQLLASFNLPQGGQYEETRHYNKAFLTLRTCRYPVFAPFSGSSAPAPLLWRDLQLRQHGRT
jgi:hypothetical protein